MVPVNATKVVNTVISEDSARLSALEHALMSIFFYSVCPLSISRFLRANCVCVLRCCYQQIALLSEFVRVRALCATSRLLCYQSLFALEIGGGCYQQIALLSHGTEHDKISRKRHGAEADRQTDTQGAEAYRQRQKMERDIW